MSRLAGQLQHGFSAEQRNDYELHCEAFGAVPALTKGLWPFPVSLLQAW